MYDPSTDVYPLTRQAASLARADALEREITDLCAQINAAGYRLLQLVAELDDEAPWGAWGLRSCAHFLNWRCGIGMNAAREKVRVAHALKSLPLISASYATGELSFSKVRAVTRVASPESNEAESDGVTAETLAADEPGRCEFDNGQGLALDTVRRIACDASLLRITEDDAGNPLDIGRKTRAVPPAMRRALQARDGGCRFPGCTHLRFVDAHHIKHWADGGDTSIDNLVLLCRHHHRLVHEGGFGVERTTGDNIRFSRPDGRVIEEHPQLPACGSVEGLRRGNRETGEAIDAASWIIPGDTLDYGMAIEGLMWKREQESGGCQADR